MQEKTTFFSENKIPCPSCENQTAIEVLRKGGGRLNTASLQDDLRRTFIVSKKYGMIFPLIYDIIVCNKCWFASFQNDFTEKRFDFVQVKSFEKQRKSLGLTLIKKDKADFTEYRDLHIGLLSYYLAAHCYNFYFEKSAVDFYLGLLSLRASWCANDLSQQTKDEEMMAASLYFRYLASLSYENFITATENTSIKDNIPFYGPDIDYDFGIKGAFYLSGLLGNEFSELINEEDDRHEFLSKLLLRLSRVFGVGKKSKNSPTPFLDKVYKLHGKIKDKSQVSKDEKP